MSTAETPITKHLDTWSSAIKAKSSAGRGNGRAREFYGIKKLRELILELAVRGLLVPQDPSDEPATALLKQVESEKQKLIEEGKIRKLNALPCISKGEEPFKISDRWKWVRLNEVASVIRGVTYKKSDAGDVETSESVPLMRANNIGRGLNFDDLIHIPRRIVNPNQIIVKGDLLIAMSSGSPALVGKAAQAIDDLNHSFGAFCAVIRSHSPALFDYFRIFFDSPLYRSQTKQIGKGIGIQNLNKESLESLLIPFPSGSAMPAIVAKVDELMALCDQLEQQQEDSVGAHGTLVEILLKAVTAASERGQFHQAWQRIESNFDTLFTTESSIDQLKQTILQLAVMGKLVEQDPEDEPAGKLLEMINKQRTKLLDSDSLRKTKPCRQFTPEETPNEIPATWAWTRLGEITEIGTGSTPSRTETSYWVGGTIPWITSGSTSRSPITEGDEFVTPAAVKAHRLRVYPCGTLLVALYGQGKTRGQVALLEIAATINQACAAICPLDGIPPMNGYLKVLLEKQYDEMRSLSAGGAQPNLNVQKIKELFVPLPPLAEQRRIVAKVDELMTLCDCLKTSLQSAQATQLNLADSLVKAAIH